MLLPAILIALDFLILTSFLQSQLRLKKIMSIHFAYAMAYSLWIARILLFNYLLLLPNLKLLLWSLVLMIFVSPHLLVLSVDRRRYFDCVRRIKLKTLAMISSSLYMISLLGENTWDGSAYHLPIEILASKYSSLFGWPEFIYAQWQQSTIQLGASYFNILFGSYFAGSIISCVSFIYLIYLF